VTSGSRWGSGGSARNYGSRVVVGIVGAWHVGCIILGNMGCFVTWEMPILDVNEPPVLLASLHDDGDTVAYDEDLPFFIAAQDPDSDAPLLFFWQVENARLFEVSYMVGEGENDEGDIWESDVTVPWDEDLDGAELTVKILDAGGATTRASWTLEVL
jgi:hypothetical protein